MSFPENLMAQHINSAARHQDGRGLPQDSRDYWTCPITQPNTGEYTCQPPLGIRLLDFAVQHSQLRFTARRSFWTGFIMYHVLISFMAHFIEMEIWPLTPQSNCICICEEKMLVIACCSICVQLASVCLAKVASYPLAHIIPAISRSTRALKFSCSQNHIDVTESNEQEVNKKLV